MVLKIPTSLKKFCVKALSESMDSRTMNHLIRNLIPDYDIYKRTGYPSSIAIPSLDIAQQIVSDVVQSGKFLSFVQALVDAWLEMKRTESAEGRAALAKSILKAHADNLWVVGTVGLAPSPIIIDENLRNVPPKQLWAWDVLWMVPYHPYTFYLADAVPMLDASPVLYTNLYSE